MPAVAQQTDCDALPESRRALCLMVQACGTQQDAERREECYRAAAQTLGGSDEADAPPALEERVVTAETAEEDDGAAAAPEPAPPAEAPPKIAESAPSAEPAESAEPTPTPSSPAVVVKTVQRTSVTIPQQFTAKVTGHRKLVRDRQLLVLDGKLLFEGDNAASSRIKVGQSVDVENVSSFRKRRYQIMGPSKRQFTALRIRCELSELGADNRRKCRIMLRDAE